MNDLERRIKREKKEKEIRIAFYNLKIAFGKFVETLELYPTTDAEQDAHMHIDSIYKKLVLKYGKIEQETENKY